MKISGAIIDLDDTLVRSEWVWEGIPERFLKRHGKTPEPDLDETIIKLNTAQIGEYFKEHYFKDSRRSARSIIWEFGAMGAPYYFFKVPLQPGAKELCKQLHDQGVKMMVLTANEKTLVKAAMRRTGILKYFDVILCGSDPENAKDNPKAFENACKVLGTPKEETFVFEDSLYATQTARSAGFPCVVMLGEKHTPEEVAAFKELGAFAVTDFKDILGDLQGPKK